MIHCLQASRCREDHVCAGDGPGMGPLMGLRAHVRPGQRVPPTDGVFFSISMPIDGSEQAAELISTGCFKRYAGG
jgi:hypothetical protein